MMEHYATTSITILIEFNCTGCRRRLQRKDVNMLIKLINDQPLKKREVLVPVKYKKGDTL